MAVERNYPVNDLFITHNVDCLLTVWCCAALVAGVAIHNDNNICMPLYDLYCRCGCGGVPAVSQEKLDCQATL